MKRSLAALQDDDINRSLCDLPGPDASTTLTTVDDIPRAAERYSLTRLHASGGIGRVWLARDSAFGRDVALKELRPERTALATHRTRFLQEARITGQLEHPGIVPVYELALRPDDQQPFYTMRFIRGRTLSEAARGWHQARVHTQAGMVDLVPLLNAFVTVCNTIAYAHSRGVIHRDLKGENVVLGDFGEVVVLDWGLAKLIGRTRGNGRSFGRGRHLLAQMTSVSLFTGKRWGRPPTWRQSRHPDTWTLSISRPTSMAWERFFTKFSPGTPRSQAQTRTRSFGKSAKNSRLHRGSSGPTCPRRWKPFAYVPWPRVRPTASHLPVN